MQVKDLLATDISEASEALAAVGVPIEKAADAPEAGVPAEAAAPTATPPTAGATSAPGAVSESEAQRAQASGKGVGVEFDAAMTRHLLHSVDEVLRRGESQDYFKNVPQEKLEQMMTSELRVEKGQRQERDGEETEWSSQLFHPHGSLLHSLTLPCQCLSAHVNVGRCCLLMLIFQQPIQLVCSAAPRERRSAAELVARLRPGSRGGGVGPHSQRTHWR